MRSIRISCICILAVAVIAAAFAPDLRAATEEIKKVYKVQLPGVYSYIGAFHRAFPIDKNTTLLFVQATKTGQSVSTLVAFTINKKGKVVRTVEVITSSIARADMVALPQTASTPRGSAENRYVVFYATVEEPVVKLFLIPLGATGQPTAAPRLFHSFTRTEGSRFLQVNMEAAVGGDRIGLALSTRSYDSGDQGRIYSGLAEVDLDQLTLLRITAYPIANWGKQQSLYSYRPEWNGTCWLTPSQYFDRRQASPESLNSLFVTSVAGNIGAAITYNVIAGPKDEAIGYVSGRIVPTLENSMAVSASVQENPEIFYAELIKANNSQGNKYTYRQFRQTLGDTGDPVGAPKLVKIRQWNPAFTLSGTETVTVWSENCSLPLPLEDGDWFIVQSRSLVIKDSAKPVSTAYRYVSDVNHLKVNPANGKVKTLATASASASNWFAPGQTQKALTFYRPGGAIGILYPFHEFNSSFPIALTAYITQYKLK